jgi:hypothetical protein
MAEKKSAPAKSLPPEAPSHVEIFWDKRDGSYWHKLNGQFLAMKKSDLQLHLRTLGLRDDCYIKTNEGNLRELDWPFWNAMHSHRVEYAGPLAGHKIGVFTDGAMRKFLVTDQAHGVFDDVPKKSPEPKMFIAFIKELLPEDARSLNGHAVEQWIHFCHWLAIAIRSLRKGDFRPGHVAVFAGPAECGKSLLQFIVTEVLGGRDANPEKYMNGEKFSADLAGAEHWQLEDPDSTTDLRTRRSFGNRLKECANNERFYIRRMHKDPISLPIFRRITLSVNDEPENLAIVPPLDDSLRDKLNLYKCCRVTEALREFVTSNQPALELRGQKIANLPQSDFDRAACKAAVRAEVPLIRAWLLRQFPTVPEELRANRFGIVSAQHPDLLAELCALAPETRLLQLIDDIVFRKGEDDKGHTIETVSVVRDIKSGDLERQLRSDTDFGFEVEKVLRYYGACGSYLGRLAKSQPDRVSKRVEDGYALWTITNPSRKGEKAHHE